MVGRSHAGRCPLLDEAGRGHVDHEVTACAVLPASGHCGIVPSTVLDLTGDTPVVLREGSGSLEALGLDVVG